MKPRLRAVTVASGIAQVIPIGGEVRQFQVQPDTARMAQLGITLEQAELLRNLSDEEIDRLAFGWGGPIVQFAAQAFRRGVALHAQAGKHHATAFVAARVAGTHGERA